MPLTRSMDRMMMTVVASRLKLEASRTSVAKEMLASTNRMMEKGLTKARRRRWRTESEAEPDRTFSPYRPRLFSTCSSL